MFKPAQDFLSGNNFCPGGQMHLKPPNVFSHLYEHGFLFPLHSFMSAIFYCYKFIIIVIALYYKLSVVYQCKYHCLEIFGNLWNNCKRNFQVCWCTLGSTCSCWDPFYIRQYLPWKKIMFNNVSLNSIEISFDRPIKFPYFFVSKTRYY